MVGEHGARGGPGRRRASCARAGRTELLGQAGKILAGRLSRAAKLPEYFENYLVFFVMYE